MISLFTPRARVDTLSFGQVLLLVAGFLLTVPRGFGGGVEYLAGGNFEPEEGTLELWLTPMAKDLAPPDDGQYHGILSFFSLAVPGEWRISSPWYRHGKQLGPKISMRSEKVKDGLTAILSSFTPDWKKAEMHHYAFVWKGKYMAHFADGRLLGEGVQGAPFTGKVGPAILTIGASGGNDPIILHAVRISSIAKDEAALAKAKPEAELSTLLLDRFDSPERITGGQTKPDVIFALEETRSGKLTGEARFVSAPSPGLALYLEGADSK